MRAVLEQVTIDMSGDAELMAWKEEKERQRQEQEVSLPCCLPLLSSEHLLPPCALRASRRDRGRKAERQAEGGREERLRVAGEGTQAVREMGEEGGPFAEATHVPCGRRRWKPRCRPGWRPLR